MRALVNFGRANACVLWSILGAQMHEKKKSNRVANFATLLLLYVLVL
jgi:hypothetical protein